VSIELDSHLYLGVMVREDKVMIIAVILTRLPLLETPGGSPKLFYMYLCLG